MARLFGLTSLVDSGLIISPSSDVELFEKIIEDLAELGRHKTWLRESAWWAILRATEAAASSQIAWREDAITAVTKRCLGDSAWTPEKVAVCLVLEKRQTAS